MEARLGASVLGLILTACDAVSTRKQELAYIWQRPFHPTLTRCLFISARYLAILIHLADIIILGSIFTAELHEPTQSPDAHICLFSLALRVITSQVMLLILHLILLLRVFGLYNQNLAISVPLLLLIVLYFVASTVAIIRGFGYMFSTTSIQFSGACLHTVSSNSRWQKPILICICGELFIQLVLHGLAWKRTIWDFRSANIAFSQSQTATALLSVLNRDGVKVFLGILAGMSAIGVGMFKRGLPTVFIFPLLISFISSSPTPCREHE